MTRVSVSLGSRALPEVLEALEHARKHPDHDPVVFAETTFPRFAELGGDERRPRRIWWSCYGKDRREPCAGGGDILPREGACADDDRSGR